MRADKNECVEFMQIRERIRRGRDHSGCLWMQHKDIAVFGESFTLKMIKVMIAI